MSDYLNISDFLVPLDISQIAQNESYKDGQLGRSIALYEDEFPGMDEVQIVLVGCGEQRGSGMIGSESAAPDIIRRHLYQLFYWHTDIRIADIGNIREGASFTDSYAALKTVVSELINDG